MRITVAGCIAYNMQRIDWVFISACLLAAPVDILISVPNWHLESNPIALWLGPVLLSTVKVVTVGIGIWLWIRTDVKETTTGKACAGFLFALYSAVFVGNLYVLL